MKSENKIKPISQESQPVNKGHWTQYSGWWPLPSAHTTIALSERVAPIADIPRELQKLIANLWEFSLENKDILSEDLSCPKPENGNKTKRQKKKTIHFTETEKEA